MFRVNVSPHPRFKRLGEDIYTDVPVAFEDVMLGGEAGGEDAGRPADSGHDPGE